MNAAPFRLVHPQVVRLASRIHAGEVVFFIGAGFSIDSEGLSAVRLMRRLILRLHALDEVAALLGSRQPDKHLSQHATNFARTFHDCFDPKLDRPPRLADYKGTVVRSLASRYFEVNEWMCNAYAALVAEIAAKTARRRSRPIGTPSDLLAAAEQKLTAGPDTSWHEKFKPVQAAWWRRARSGVDDDRKRRSWGKLLFLDTLGFFDPDIMGGQPPPPDQAMPPPPGDQALIESAYVGRLFPRHHTLARLAREGLCPTLVTTNFDLLLETAFRLAGFQWRCEPPAPMVSSVPHLDVIASPAAFFTRGKAFRTATVVKLHGCANELRKLTGGGAVDSSRSANPERVFPYISQLVYTYREIQNWRDDSWAADYVRTLLRTRTFAFCGYSTADPVMHDTFRSVYEEMARKRKEAEMAHRKKEAPPRRAADAPAYFFAFNPNVEATDSFEFHGCEVLHAATDAVGAKPSPRTKDHPNYLRYRPTGSRPYFPPARVRGSQRRASPPPGSQLTVDEQLSWTHHFVLRLQQRKALRAELPALAQRLMGHLPAAEIKDVIQRFDARIRGEMSSIRPRNDSRATIARCHHAFHTALNWTTGFHRALLREWASAQTLQREGRPSPAVIASRRPHWYYPASESPAWTAWGAVLELALIELARFAATGASTQPAGSSPNLALALGTQADRPTVLFRRSPTVHSPLLALSLQARGLSEIGARPDIPGHPARYAIWTLSRDALPWMTETSPRLPPALPSRKRPNRAPGDKNDAPLRHPFRAEDQHWIAAPPAHQIWNLARANPSDISPEILLGSWQR